jgi:hypothetical protein
MGSGFNFLFKVVGEVLFWEVDWPIRVGAPKKAT